MTGSSGEDSLEISLDRGDSLKCEAGGLAGPELRVKDVTETDLYRIELRSYMHKEQFKDCANEVVHLALLKFSFIFRETHELS